MSNIAPVTLEILECFLSCRYKAYLRLIGQSGAKSDYERMQNESRQELRDKAIEKILHHYPEGTVVQGITLTRLELLKSPSFVLDASLLDNDRLILFDGLKRVNGDSNLGNFHYEPVLFSESCQIHETQRLLLEILRLFLARIQTTPPTKGVVYHGNECSVTSVRFGAGLKRAEDLLAEVIRIQQGTEAPKLILNPHCQVCEFKARCHAEAVKGDDLSLLSGMHKKEVKSYARKGLFTLTQLAHTFRPRRKGKRPESPWKQRNFALQALAIRDKRLYVLGAPKVPSGPVQIFVDMEGIPDEGFVYLIGMVICESHGETRRSFWADSKEQEKAIFEQFISLIEKYDSPLIFCYGSYERAFIKRMRRYVRAKKTIDNVLGSLVNILSIIYAYFYFPTYTNGLKEIAGSLAFSWTEEGASGIQSIVWRKRWDKTNNDQWKAKLIEYNLEDCEALQKVTCFLQKTCAEVAVPTAPLQKTVLGPQVALVSDLDKLANRERWGRLKSQNPDFVFVNKYAYFDYQRERVFVRTNKLLKKRLPISGSHKNRTIRVSKRIFISASKCPVCGSKSIATITAGLRGRRVETRNKRVFDLVVTSGGVKRRVIEARASAYRCSSCGHCFISERYRRLAKHYHNLMSWAMYLHVAHRLSFGTLEVLFRDLFGLAVHATEIHAFKTLMATYYRVTYRRLLSKIIHGAVMHVDETEVKLRGKKGYVWVFANVEEVAYMYRPTREGGFLRDLLKNFEGVLISDFYAAYDLLKCHQQKCLVHLMRDMNQELLDNPFDEELRSITQPFGALLRSIVETVDMHGLKKIYLRQHADDVSKFFQCVSDASYVSDAAQSLQQRLMRCRDKLFTFIEYDGVSWNNNNAENSIKHFAYYRESVEGVIKEPGLNDYLLLLSMHQTCKYKGISFLKFLLSGERDIDKFCEKRRSKTRKTNIELYPKGFTPAAPVQRPREKVAQQS
jgi:predicted RecB family nuclease